MRHVTTLTVLVLVLLLSGCGSGGSRTPPEIRRGVKVLAIRYTHGSDDYAFVVEEVRQNWAFIRYEDDKLKPRWLNFDNVITYRVKD
jgi:hypothetical protein